MPFSPNNGDLTLVTPSPILFIHCAHLPFAIAQKVRIFLQNYHSVSLQNLKNKLIHCHVFFYLITINYKILLCKIFHSINKILQLVELYYF